MTREPHAGETIDVSQPRCSHPAEPVALLPEHAGQALPFLVEH